MDKLASYKLDKAFTEGVVIRLDGAPDVAFLVKLPSQYNRQYTQAMYGAMEWSVDGGEVKTGGNLMKMRATQEDAFVEHCLQSIDDEPIPDGFRADYPEAVQELMSKADDLTAELQERVETSVKKSPTSSVGSGTGRAKSDSMPSLKAGAV